MAIAVFLPLQAVAQSADPSALPRLNEDGLQYLGGFRLPAQPANGDTFAIGGRQMVFNPASHSLFIGSRAGRVAEVSIPGVVNSGSINALPSATYLQPFSDPTEGRLAQIAPDGVALDGLLIYNNRLYGSASIYYDATNAQRVSHYSRSLQLNQPSFSGWSSVWDAGKTGYVSGVMALVPQEWQARLGGPAITGQCCIPIVTRTSWGPAAFAFDPSAIAESVTVPANPLLYYTGDHQTLGPWDGSNPTYGSTTQIGGVAIVAGTRTVLYFGRNGMGEACYGNGTNNPSLAGAMAADGAHYCYDPTNNSKGTHAYPYRYQVWAYDLNDFAAVRAGTKQPWEVVPYGVWPLQFPFAEETVALGGVGYDPVAQVIYVSQMLADRDGYEFRPIIHAFQLNAQGATAPASIPPPASAPEAPPASVPNAPAEPSAGGVISAITLVANRTAPQLAGTAVTFTATAAGGVTPYQYKFLLYDGAGWQAMTEWSELSSFTWTPTQPSVLYRVGVWARSAGNAADEPESSASSPFIISAPVPVNVGSVSIASNKTSPQATGSSITWTATATGGVAPLQYKWLVYDGGWTPVSEWSIHNTFTWTPTVARSDYRVGVWVRSAFSTADADEASAHEPFTIAAPVAQTIDSVMLSANKIAPQPVGSTVVATATVSGGAGPYTYKWFVYDAYGWQAVGGWTSSNTFSWTPSRADANYQLGVWVRQAGNTADALEKSATLPFPIQ